MPRPIPPDHALVHVAGRLLMVDLGPWVPPETGEETVVITPAGEIVTAWAIGWRSAKSGQVRIGRIVLRDQRPIGQRRSHVVPVIGRVVAVVEE